MKNKYNDELFDVLLKQAIEEQVVVEDDALVQQYSQDAEFSSGFETRMQKVLKKPRKLPFRKIIAVALIAAVLFALLATPVGAGITDWVTSLFQPRTNPMQMDVRSLEAYPEYVSLYNSLDPEWDYFYIPNHKYTADLTPDIDVIQNDGGSIIMLKFTTVDYHIYIDQYRPPAGDFYMDSEFGDFEEVQVNGHTAFVRRTGGDSTLHWEDGTTSVWVYTNLSLEILIDIASTLYAFSPNG